MRKKLDKDGQSCVLLIKVFLEEHNTGTLFLEGSLSYFAPFHSILSLLQKKELSLGTIF